MWINQEYENKKVVDYVREELTSTMYRGELENIPYSVDNMIVAFGRLLNNLAERGLIQEVDLKKIVENCTVLDEEEYKLTKD
jgi:hypothetical protein